MNDALARFRQSLRCSMLGACPRRYGYAALREEEVAHISEEKEQLFLDGWWHEYEVKRRLAGRGVLFEAGIRSTIECAVPLYKAGSDGATIHVPGHLDGIIKVEKDLPGIPIGRYILEVKGLGGTFWSFIKKGLRISHPAYFDQVQGELHADGEKAIRSYGPPHEDPTVATALRALVDGIAEVQIPHSSLLRHWPTKAVVVAKSKEKGNIHSQVIEPDEGAFASLCRRWRAADDAVANGDLPLRLHETPNNWECKECPFQEECWGGEEDDRGLQVPIAKGDPSLLEVAERYAQGYQLAKEGEAMMAEAKPVLDAGEGNYSVGPVTVMHSQRKHQTWAKERLLEERMIPVTTIKVREI